MHVASSAHVRRLYRIAMLVNNPINFDNRVQREAMTLAQAGHQVTLFGTRPVQPATPATQTAEQALFQTPNLTVLRELKPLPRYQSFNKRTLRAMATMLLHRIRQPKVRFEVIHIHDANMLTLGMFLAQLYNAKVVYDSHEYWPAIFDEERERLQTKRVQGKLTSRQLKQAYQNLVKLEDYETQCLTRVDAVITVCHGLGEYLYRRRVGLTETVLQTAPEDVPCCDLTPEQHQTFQASRPKALLREAPPEGFPILLRNICDAPAQRPHTPPRQFHQTYHLPELTKVLLYQGHIAPVRAVDTMLNALLHPALASEALTLVLMGPVEPVYQEAFSTLCQQVQAQLDTRHTQHGEAPKRIIVHPAVPFAELLEWTASADLGLCLVRNFGLSRYHSLPNKIFEYIQAGLPMMVSAFPEMSQLVQQYGVGWCVDPESADALAEQIAQVVRHPETLQNFRQAVTQAQPHLCWEVERQKLLDLYQTL